MNHAAVAADSPAHSAVPQLSPHSPSLQHLLPHERQLFCRFAQGPSVAPTHTTCLAAILHSLREHASRRAAVQMPHDARPPTAASAVDSSTAPDAVLAAAPALTYAELDAQSDALAVRLAARGVARGDAVALFVRRGLPMLVGLVAILKLGACYVPQSVGIAPPEQLQHVARACSARVVLTTNDLAKQLPQFEPHVAVLAIDRDLAREDEPATAVNGAAAAAVAAAQKEVVATDRCYIIFTSGTTGQPKGVQVSHGNVANVLLTKPMSLDVAPSTRVAQLLNVAFDMAAWEMLVSLCHGGTLVIRGRSIAATVARADVVIATPTVLATVDAAIVGRNVRVVAVAGEPCPPQLPALWRHARFYNSCGPTEVTIINTAKLVSSSACTAAAARRNGGSVSIGRPTPNNTVYVLDAAGKAVVRGATGEMWAGGLCVSAGYLNLPDQTDARFVPDPFLGGAWRMYRTGDLARWEANGELTHLGRADDQVKVRGFRVELAGVAAVIETLPAVRQAVALKVGDALAAFVHVGGGTALSARDVQDRVRADLPYYCTPERVVLMRGGLPTTKNGKADRAALLRALDGSAGVAVGDEKARASWAMAVWSPLLQRDVRVMLFAIVVFLRKLWLGVMRR